MITEETVRHVAKLARLALSEEEVRLYTDQLGDILGYIDQLNEVDTTGVPPTARAIPLANVMREDELRDDLDLDVETALGNAPSREGNYFRVPKIY